MGDMFKRRLLMAQILAFMLIILIIAPSASQLFIPLSTTVFAQSANQNQVNPSATTGNFRFAYTKIEVSGGSFLRITYDSETNALSITNTSSTTRATTSDGSDISSSQRTSQSQSNRNTELSDSNKTNLRQLINATAFFQANNVYPPNASGPQDYTLHILSITMDNKSRTVLWSDTSSNVPAGMSRIAQTMEEIASK
jgi:hypothetical protein